MHPLVLLSLIALATTQILYSEFSEDDVCLRWVPPGTVFIAIPGVNSTLMAAVSEQVSRGTAPLPSACRDVTIYAVCAAFYRPVTYAFPLERSLCLEVNRACAGVTPPWNCSVDPLTVPYADNGVPFANSTYRDAAIMLDDLAAVDAAPLSCPYPFVATESGDAACGYPCKDPGYSEDEYDAAEDMIRIGLSFSVPVIALGLITALLMPKMRIFPLIFLTMVFAGSLGTAIIQWIQYLPTDPWETFFCKDSTTKEDLHSVCGTLGSIQLFFIYLDSFPRMSIFFHITLQFGLDRYDWYRDERWRKRVFYINLVVVAVLIALFTGLAVPHVESTGFGCGLTGSDGKEYSWGLLLWIFFVNGFLPWVTIFPSLCRVIYKGGIRSHKQRYYTFFSTTAYIMASSFELLMGAVFGTIYVEIHEDTIVRSYTEWITCWLVAPDISTCSAHPEDRYPYNYLMLNQSTLALLGVPTLVWLLFRGRSAIRAWLVAFSGCVPAFAKYGSDQISTTLKSTSKLTDDSVELSKRTQDVQD